MVELQKKKNMRKLKRQANYSFSEESSEELPCTLLEYFQATPAVDTAPITLPVRPKFTASLAVFS